MDFNSFKRGHLAIEYENDQNNTSFDIFNTNLNFNYLLNSSKIKMNFLTNKLSELHKSNKEKITKIEKEIFDIDIIERSNKNKKSVNKNTRVSTNENSILSPYINLSTNIDNNHFSQQVYSGTETLIQNKNQTRIIDDIKFIIQMRSINNTDAIIEYLESTKNINFSLFKYQILIFLILIYNSKDNTIFESIQNLDKVGFNINTISELNLKTLQKLISSVNFSDKKAIEIKNLTSEVALKFMGDPPETLYEILNLPGIEIKTAQIYFNLISVTNNRIIVTSHVQRISNRYLSIL